MERDDMSDWVNWQQFSELNRPEVQRQADERNEAMRAEKARMDQQLYGLSNRAFDAADVGRFSGTRNTAGYGDVMRQRDEAMRAQVGQNQQMAPWESELTRGVQRDENPWGRLGARLADIDNRAMRRNEQRNWQVRDQQERAQREAFNKAEAARMHEEKYGRREREAEQYRRWSQAVDRAASTNRGGGGGAAPGAGAYYDYLQGWGPGPVPGQSNPAQQRFQRNIAPTNPSADSGFDTPYKGWW